MHIIPRFSAGQGTGHGGTAEVWVAIAVITALSLTLHTKQSQDIRDPEKSNKKSRKDLILP